MTANLLEGLLRSDVAFLERLHVLKKSVFANQLLIDSRNLCSNNKLLHDLCDWLSRFHVDGDPLCWLIVNLN